MDINTQNQNNGAPVPQAKPPICLRPHTPTAALPAPVGADELLNDASVVMPSELVNGLIHQGTKVVLASGSKAGKTWILLHLAISVATGARFLRWNTTAGKVLYVNFEIARPFIKGRLRVLKDDLKLQSLGNLRVLNLRGYEVDAENFVRRLGDSIRNEGYSMIVIDPIYKLMVGHAENAASTVGALCHTIEKLAEKTGAAVVYAHHFTKGNASKKKAMDRMSGSGVFARDPDTIITLTEHRVNNCYSVHMTLRNLPAQPAFVVEWQFPKIIERTELDAADLKESEEIIEEIDPEDVLALLDDGPLTQQAWLARARQAGISQAGFTEAKEDLEANGLVEFNAASQTWSVLENGDFGSGEDEADDPIRNVNLEAELPAEPQNAANQEAGNDGPQANQV